MGWHIMPLRTVLDLNRSHLLWPLVNTANWSCEVGFGGTRELLWRQNRQMCWMWRIGHVQIQTTTWRQQSWFSQAKRRWDLLLFHVVLYLLFIFTEPGPRPTWEAPVSRTSSESAIRRRRFSPLRSFSTNFDLPPMDPLPSTNEKKESYKDLSRRLDCKFCFAQCYLLYALLFACLDVYTSLFFIDHFHSSFVAT